MFTRVKKIRKALGLSQREFGEGLGVSRDVIGNIECGRVPPRELLLLHLCQQYRVNPSWLETGEGEMFADTVPKSKADEALEVFRSLRPEFQDYALEQMRQLAKLQKQNQ